MNKPTPPLSMINGRFVDHLEVSDRGLAYGDGVFETIRLEHGRAPLLKFHLDRLTAGCELLAIPLARTHIESSFQRFIAALAPRTSATLKLIVTRGSGGMGYKPPSMQTASPTVIWQCLPLTNTQRLGREGVWLHPCKLPIYANPNLAGLKHLNRLDYVLAAGEVPDDPCVQGLLLDDRGNLLETLHHNLFIVKDNVLMTPKMSRSGVKGVMRRLIVEHLAMHCALVVQEGDYPVSLLQQADEVFISNSVRGIWPVQGMGDLRWNVPGALTSRLQLLVDNIFANRGDGAWW